MKEKEKKVFLQDGIEILAVLAIIVVMNIYSQNMMQVMQNAAW